MVLSDADIQKAVEGGVIGITPRPNFDEQLGSCALDLRLGKKYRVFNHSRTPFIDPQNPDTLKDVTTEIDLHEGESFTLHPGEFILAVTDEYITMPDIYVGRLEGRSSIGRLGIVVHSTAATIDAGFCGNITLELANMGRIPVMLYPGMRICSISFEELTSPARVPYNKKKSAKYAGQESPVASKIAEES